METEHSHAIVPEIVYWKTFGMLIVLMAATVFFGVAPQYVPAMKWLQTMSVAANLIAIGIAVWKATLVIRIFMGVKFSSKLIKTFAIGGFVWLLVLGIMFVDYFTRPWEPVPGWEKEPSSALPRSGSMKE
jgi:caa(3)-type oxidase subunit IV